MKISRCTEFRGKEETCDASLDQNDAFYYLERFPAVAILAILDKEMNDTSIQQILLKSGRS